jgi:hypothetical protein
MRKTLYSNSALPLVILSLMLSVSAMTATAQSPQVPSAAGELVNLNTIDPASLKTRFATVTRSETSEGLVLDYENSPKWPSVDFAPAAGVWDLSAYAGVEAVITNEGTNTVKTIMSVYNPGIPGKMKSNGTKQDIAPGETVTMTALFGKNPNPNKAADSLDLTQISIVKIFVGKVSSPSKLKVSSLKVVKKDAAP